MYYVTHVFLIVYFDIDKFKRTFWKYFFKKDHRKLKSFLLKAYSRVPVLNIKNAHDIVFARSFVIDLRLLKRIKCF